MTNLSINDGQSTMTPKDSGKDGGLWAKKVCCMSAGKWCTLCAVASVVVMVSIPVGVLVVGPMIAQKILDGTVISLPNSTVSSCTTPKAWVQNTAKINVPFFLPSTLLSYTQVLSTTMCSSSTAGYACDHPNVTKMGSYVSPVMHLSGGESIQTFDSTLDVADTSVVLNGFVNPLFLDKILSGANHSIRMILSAEDVTISVLGIKLKGLKMHKELTCKGEKLLHMLDPQPIPNKVCYPGQNRTGFEQDTSAGYYMSCVAGALPIEETPTTTPAPTMSGAAIIF